MKYYFLLFLLPSTILGFSQDLINSHNKGRKGEMFIYWGWNRGVFTKSDIHFKGKDYDFTLKKVVAKDKPNKFGFNPYFNPSKITIPQYNFRIGYFIKNNYNISIGIDHMKYVVQQNQTTQITGSIQNSGTPYDGNYNNDDIIIEEGFLKFEHTNGLNYINAEVRRFDEVYSFHKNIKLNLTEGIGAGVLFPKTNTTLLNNERYDEFHIAGYGVHAVVGANLTFFQYFFIQSELRGGYIDMPDIRTTKNKEDIASQHFFFGQFNWVFGASFNLIKTKEKSNDK